MFPYIVQTIVYDNSDWAVVYQNMRKEWRKWVIIVWVLARIRSMVRGLGMMYKAMTQSVLPCGSER